MQASAMGFTWYWETCLQASKDNPWNPNMSCDYPSLYCNAIVAHSGPPMPIYGGALPSAIPGIGGNNWVFPSSAGGFGAYLNLFATGTASWIIPSTSPYYGWLFGFTFGSVAATLPSNYSFWQFQWVNKGPFNQYQLLSGHEYDCLGGSGNKGRNYSIISDADNGYLWYWNNTCGGAGLEWCMCLWVQDTITMPVNANAFVTDGPYAASGFDLGIATIVPNLSSGCFNLGFATLDYTDLVGDTRIALASFAFWPCIGPYGQNGYRIPHGWDLLSNTFLGLNFLFTHAPGPGFPSPMWGTTNGGFSAWYPFPPDPGLNCAEIRWSTYNLGKGKPMSASFMTCFF
jgi:hypothetical protein